MAALKKVLKTPDLKTTGSSRTDTGVHAHDQRVSFATTNPIPTDGLQRALNRRLPLAIRVREIREAAPGFSARYHAKAKHYGYLIHNGENSSPFIAPYVWEHRPRLNETLMAEATTFFEGSRCFKAFQAHRDVRRRTQTTIYSATIERRGDLIYFDVFGRNFLYHMVRNMVGALVKVGRGEWTPEEMGERLATGKRTEMWITAPAGGLHLFEVFFESPPYLPSQHSRVFREHIAMLAHPVSITEWTSS